MSRLITVLGMHRSGTSAVAGLLADHGIGFGWMRESNAFNPRGNRENRELRWLHDAILERNGGSWFRPPETIELEAGDRERRDEELVGFEGDVIAVKDPRLLLLMELWRDLKPSSIGVIRNPVAVRESLERRSLRKRPEQKRARQHKNPQLEPKEWEALWCAYNERLLAEVEGGDVPVVDFDRAEALDEQVRRALEKLDVDAPGSTSFYDPELATEVDEGWRERALLSRSVELWERLSERARP